MGRPVGSKNKPKVKEVTNAAEEHPLQRLVGQLVTYYDDGWRYGTLIEVNKNGKYGRIQPIRAYKAESGHCIKQQLTNIAEIAK